MTSLEEILDFASAFGVYAIFLAESGQRFPWLYRNLQRSGSAVVFLELG